MGPSDIENMRLQRRHKMPEANPDPEQQGALSTMIVQVHILFTSCHESIPQRSNRPLGMRLRRTFPLYIIRACAGPSLAAVALLLGAPEARAEHATAADVSASSPAAVSMPTPIDALGADLVDAFSGSGLFLFGGAVATTGLMALGGTDQAFRVVVQRDLFSPAVADAAFYAGYILPAAVGSVLYSVGFFARDPVVAGAGAAALQALGMTVVATGLLKLAGGRPYPLNGGDPHAPDRLDHPEYARQFRPFQSIWPLPSWPSGHTSTSVCVAAALTGYYPDRIWIPLVGYSLALFIGFGMVDGDSHWASDVVAGALVGQAIGYAVGRAFRRRTQAASDQSRTGLTLMPVVTPTYGGVSAFAAW
jgi:membrane-associated phospholipid phosphatase